MGTYNGWTNKATWNLYTWLSNDGRTYKEVLHFVSEFRQENLGHYETLQGFTEDCAHAFKEDFVFPNSADFYSPVGVSGWVRDTIISTINEVDFEQVIAPWIEEHFEAEEIVLED